MRRNELPVVSGGLRAAVAGGVVLRSAAAPLFRPVPVGEVLVGYGAVLVVPARVAHEERVARTRAPGVVRMLQEVADGAGIEEAVPEAIVDVLDRNDLGLEALGAPDARELLGSRQEALVRNDDEVGPEPRGLQIPRMRDEDVSRTERAARENGPEEMSVAALFRGRGRERHLSVGIGRDPEHAVVLGVEDLQRRALRRVQHHRLLLRGAELGLNAGRHPQEPRVRELHPIEEHEVDTLGRLSEGPEPELVPVGQLARLQGLLEEERVLAVEDGLAERDAVPGDVHRVVRLLLEVAVSHEPHPQGRGALSRIRRGNRDRRGLLVRRLDLGPEPALLGLVVAGEADQLLVHLEVARDHRGRARDDALDRARQLRGTRCKEAGGSRSRRCHLEEVDGGRGELVLVGLRAPGKLSEELDREPPVGAAGRELLEAGGPLDPLGADPETIDLGIGNPATRAREGRVGEPDDRVAIDEDLRERLGRRDRDRGPDGKIGQQKKESHRDRGSAKGESHHHAG